MQRNLTQQSQISTGTRLAEHQMMGYDLTAFVNSAAASRLAPSLRSYDARVKARQGVTGDVAWHPLLRRNAFNNEMTYVSSLARVLEGNCTDIALCIEIKNGVFIQISGFRYVSVAELNVQRVRIVKVADFHGLNALSEKVLCAGSVWQQDYPEVATLHFLDSSPAPYSTIGPRVGSFRLPDDMGNPLIFDGRPIRPDW